MAENQLQQYWDAIQDLPLIDREQVKLNYYNSMSNLKQRQKQYKDAIKYAKKNIKQTKFIYGQGSDQQYQAYYHLCALYILDNDSVQAFACLDSLRHGVGHSYQDKEWIAYFYNFKGSCYDYFKEYKKAIRYFNKAYNTLDAKATEKSSSKIQSLLNKTETYLKLKRYDEAFTIYREYTNAIKNKYGETSDEYYQVLFLLSTTQVQHRTAIPGAGVA